MVSLFTYIGYLAINTLAGIGRYFVLLQYIFRLMPKRPYRIKQLVEQLEFFGNKSFFIIFLAGSFTGAVFGLQLGMIFKIFRAEGLTGAAVGISLARELSPVLTGLLVAGRAGSSIASEIGSMRVNEQIDALEVMAIDPINYLVIPRTIAAIFMLPLLAGLFTFVGVYGAYIVGKFVVHIDQAIFIDKLQWLVTTSDITKGLFKAGVFGFLIATIGCFHGLGATGGSVGVGNATTKTVVHASIAILITDFVITYFQM